MNRWKYLFGLVVVAMASCAADEGMDDSASEGLLIGNSGVEIRLSSGSNQGSRAIVDSDVNGNFELDGLSIFCLADKQLKNGQKLPIDWSTPAGKYSVWIAGKEANATIDNVTDPANPITNIDWADGSVQYYPTGTAHSYSFYGYYLDQPTLAYYNDSIVATFNLDSHKGKWDALWGVAKSDEDYAYSAKYFRDPLTVENKPSMQFEHKLMRLTFSIEAGPDAYDNYDKAVNMEVVGIRLDSIPTTGRLMVANKAATGRQSGSITYNWNSQNKVSWPVPEEDDSELGSGGQTYFPGVVTPTPVGGALMVPVPADDSYQYWVRVVMYNRSLPVADQVQIVSIPLPLNLREGAHFEEGKQYNVNLMVYGPEEIQIRAKLSQWEKIDDVFENTEV